MFNLQIVILSHSGTGAGIYSVDAAPGYESRPIANNGVIIAGSASDDDRIRFECISNSSQVDVGSTVQPKQFRQISFTCVL